MLRSVLFTNVVHSSNRNVSGLSLISKMLNHSHQSFLKQLLNSSRCVHNYKTSSDNLSPAKISRTMIFHKYLRLVKHAIRDSGPVLKLNPKLACVIENAKKNNLSPEFIDFAVKISCDVRATVGLYDVLLPNGCQFLVQYEDIDSTRTKHHLLLLCEKYDGTLLQNETVWPKSFEQKGIVSIECKDSDPFSTLSEETISKIGVQSFRTETDIEGIKYWKFYCDPWQLPEVIQQLSQMTNSVEEAYVGYLPKKKIVPSYYLRNNIFNMFIKLCEVPSIDNVYTNVSIV